MYVSCVKPYNVLFQGRGHRKKVSLHISVTFSNLLWLCKFVCRLHYFAVAQLNRSLKKFPIHWRLLLNLTFNFRQTISTHTLHLVWFLCTLVQCGAHGWCSGPTDYNTKVKVIEGTTEDINSNKWISPTMPPQHVENSEIQ